MAVTSMRLVNVTGTLEKLDAVLDACSAGEDFQFEQAMSFFGDKSDFVPINDENPYSAYYSKASAMLEESGLELADEDGDDISSSGMTWEEIGGFVDDISGQFRELAEERQSYQQRIAQCSTELEELRHFEELDIRLEEIFECEYIKVRFGRLPRESYSKLKYYSDNPYVMMLTCSSDSQYVWGLYFAPIDNVAEVDRIFQSLMWERLHLPDIKGTPANECLRMKTELQKLEEADARSQQTVESFWTQNEQKCTQLYRMLERRNRSYELRRYVARYRNTDRFFLAGWVPEDDADDFYDRIVTLGDVECDISEPDTAGDHSPPVKLKNRFFAKPFEFYVSMYGLPDYKEIDPTPFVAFTYFLLFGMMFADLGQGLVLSLVGFLFMWKMKGMELGRIMGLCGLSSAFFGVLLGSVFGFEHWLDPFWAWVHEKTGVPLNHGKLINIEDTNVVTTLIYATVAVGAVLVACAMLLNIYSKLKQRIYGEALFSQNGLAGLVFYTAVIYAAVNALVLGGGAPSKAYIWLLIVLPLVLIFLREPLSELIEGKEKWMPENIGDFLMQNFFELFEVLLSYVSNTVSFLRIGAFILVHYGMMTVVFTLAGNDPRSAKFIIVVVLGNIMIIALEGLLSGIQALRLEFYEMFSRFYSGDGRPFVPAGKTLSDVQ